MNFPYKYKLAEPEQESDRVAILLPGISGKALSDRYSELEQKLNQAGFSFFRYDSWKSIPDALGKSFQEIHNGIDQAIDFVKSQGYRYISFIGKSIGGGTLLTYPSSEIESMVLWAPYIKFADRSTLDRFRNTRFSDIDYLKDMLVSKEDLEKIKTPTLIVHGTEDEEISLENSQAIVGSLPNGTLETVEGAGHSYEKPGEMEKVVKYTIDFLTK
tara:strand:+ start:267 stop:911 length:645 start_codon:yes stop_codon:yes gene_type:complete